MSNDQIKFWDGEFKRGRTSLENQAGMEYPHYATDKGMCNRFWDLVYSDRQIQAEEIAQALGISHGTVLIMVHGLEGMGTLTANCVPKSFIDEQKATRASICSALLKMIFRLVIVDEA